MSRPMEEVRAARAEYLKFIYAAIWWYNEYIHTVQHVDLSIDFLKTSFGVLSNKHTSYAKDNISWSVDTRDAS